MKVKIKKLHPEAKIPLKATKEAACADVYATEILKDEIQKYNVTVKLGFSTEIPNGYKGIIVPRSSFTHKGWVMQNSPAQIDSDYRGEWMIKFESLDDYLPFPYKVGDRVAQIFFEKVVDYEFEEVTEVAVSERGEGGFGSTGK